MTAQESADDAREAVTAWELADQANLNCRALIGYLSNAGRPGLASQYLPFCDAIDNELLALKQSPAAPTSPDESRSAGGEAI